MPPEAQLLGVPTFPVERLSEGVVADGGVVGRVASLLLLLSSQEAGVPARSSRVWLGEGLGAVSKKVYDRVLRWEYIDLQDFKPRTGAEKDVTGIECEKLVVLPGLEVAQSRRKPILSILTWVQCYCKYMAAVSLKFPEAVAGMVGHLLVVVKAYLEVEEPGWRLYDEAFREKMAATGVRLWKGVDVQVFQGTCGGLLRRSVKSGGESVKGRGLKRVLRDEIQGTCWLFNEGTCRFGATCKFAHKCALCGGPHRRMNCSRGGEEKRAKN